MMPETFSELAEELIVLLDEQRPFLELWTLIRRLEELRRATFGESMDSTAWDGCGVRFSRDGLTLTTRHPTIAEDFRTAVVYHDQKLSLTEETELRGHLRVIIGAWLRAASRKHDKSDAKTTPQKKPRNISEHAKAIRKSITAAKKKGVKLTQEQAIADYMDEHDYLKLSKPSLKQQLSLLNNRTRKRH